MLGTSILVIDDDPLMREFVEEAMRRRGWVVDAAPSGKAGLALFAKKSHDVVITDLKMTPIDGLAVLREIRNENHHAQVIIMTGYATIETAVEALKNGAADYLLKPFAPDALDVAVDRALEHTRLLRENSYLRQEFNAEYDFAGMIGVSAAMRGVYEQIQKVADSRATVLIRGESGVGKELAARAIHYSGCRRDNPFVRVNCPALSAGILESELFGHEKGAFTGAHERKIGRFELADTGSLLLDEVSEINLELQPKLLRALQEREFERVGGVQTLSVDTRIIATSNRDLEQAVTRGLFREDLFFRLNVIVLSIPPLRERRDDIPPLIEHFRERANRENGRCCSGLTQDARRLLAEYNWPGNIRELQHAVERAVILFDEPVLDARHFQLSRSISVASGDAAGALIPGMTVAEMEKNLILKTLEHCGGNRARSAETLGISVRTLRNKLKEYDA